MVVFLPLVLPAGSGGRFMCFWRRPTSLLLILVPVWLSGCNRSDARSAVPRPSPVKGQTLTTPVRKHPQRDSALAVYRHPEYGVTFRYPRNFELQEEFEPGSTEPLERLTGQQPGALPVAAVLISSDAYPNTTFRGGTLQVVVNRVVQPETCQSFAAPGDPDPQDSTGTSTISGVLFHWRQSSHFVSPVNYSTRLYTAFFHSACYEFYLEVTDAASMDPDPAERPADTARILHHLEKILSSLEIYSRAPVTAPRILSPSPSLPSTLTTSPPSSADP
jgi:hypothetical protein